ncbi:hypothetical protein SEA_ASHTON_43 [Microbacterium phage Ashton]|uniref:Uncharacterized protein n=1 Tax=Microbacterium phage Ashton TaxID=2562366 RepID=A0A6M3T391_9CAUD|nr:hypothetical protein SEA_ASHTON_43 [Microbacterium phage Ashton]
MALWDDIVRTFTGGSAQPTPKRSGAISKATSAVARPSTPRSAAPAQPKFSSVLEPTQPQSAGRGGGGGRGMVGASVGGSFSLPTETKPKDDEDALTEVATTKVEQKPKFNFWDDLGAYFTTPVEGSVFTSPGIAGAAQRKHDAENARTEAGLKPGDIPNNEQLKQLGRDDEMVNVDGNLVPLNGSPQGNATAIGQAQAADAQTARDTFNTNVSNGFARVTVRELSPEEWAALSPEQQQSVSATYALFKASQEDQASELPNDAAADYNDVVTATFGAKGNSDTYAPATVALLQELGYKNESADLDQFIDRSALPSYEDILGTSTGTGAAERQSVAQGLASSALFDNQTITDSLAQGQDLMDALRVSGAVSNEFKRLSGTTSDYSSLTDQDFEDLNTLLNNLSNRQVFARLDSEPDLGQRLNDSIALANEMYGADLVSRYFTEALGTFDDTTNYMTPDEFYQNWMRG